jgi:hypothetical protein
MPGFPVNRVVTHEKVLEWEECTHRIPEGESVGMCRTLAVRHTSAVDEGTADVWRTAGVENGAMFKACYRLLKSRYAVNYVFDRFWGTVYFIEGTNAPGFGESVTVRIPRSGDILMGYGALERLLSSRGFRETENVHGEQKKRATIHGEIQRELDELQGTIRVILPPTRGTEL